MDNSLIQADGYIKRHEDKTWMSQKWIQEGLTTKQIANELHISVKLVIIWLKKHGIF